ncbi:hypothetical protein [Albimonas pacifica]|uniref:Uncharacterized protein n=1 Tax=Albimonas pacifica TaxID=1114924 RepID=A0A1I3DGA5_9RHOB|nr:hypothetical protein [Albimonas pacifica]SFH85764.1 hypothetical protein SAMN05216258_102575 [Albimonas pacifica]
MSGRGDGAGAGQLGFDALLASADAANEARRFARSASDLPESFEAAVPSLRALIEDHHAAMLAADGDRVSQLRHRAALLAQKLNGGDRGILAGPDAPGCRLAATTAATPGRVPLWGQAGVFDLDLRGMQVRIEMDGVYDIGASSGFWPGFAARAVRRDRPFFSETGFRSFLGIAGAPAPGMLPDRFAAAVIEAHIDRKRERRGR